MWLFIKEDSNKNVGINLNKFKNINKGENNTIILMGSDNDSRRNYVKNFNTEEERDFYFDYLAIKLEVID